MRRLCLASVSVAALVTLGCTLPVDLENEATSLIDEIESAPATIERARSAFDEELASSPVRRAQELATREELVARFDEADTAVIDAQACAEDLQTVLDREWLSGQDKVQGLVFRCHHLAGRVTALTAEPGQTLDRWEAFLGPAGDGPAKEALAHAEPALASLAALPELGQDVAAMGNRFPHKRPDLDARLADLSGLSEPMETHLSGVRDQLELRGEPDFDPAAFARDIDEVEHLASVIAFGDGDLRHHLDTLPATYALVVTRVERNPIYFVRTARWTWTSSTSGDGTQTDLGWSTTTEDVYEQAVANDGLVLQSTGSDSSGGSSTEVVDWDMSFETWATTFERLDGVETEPVRAQVDHDTFWDLYMLAKGLHAAFPDDGVILEQTIGATTDEDEIPHQVDLATRFAIEQKFPGQYHDERAITPSLDGTPLSAIGNPELGAWDGDVWVWTPAFLEDYRAIPGYHSPHEARFLEGYTRTAHQPYQAWRTQSGWDEQYDEHGRWRVYAFVGGYRTMARQGGHSLRGVGPDTRARGLGGGK